MADTSAADTETTESGPSPDPCHVHGTLPRGLLPGEEALQDLQPVVPRSSIPDMLQRSR